MPTAQAAASSIYCDGCAREASPEHLRSRITRLEWASRFRPIHIGALFLIPAPAAALEDFFYCPKGPPQDPDARALQEDLLESCGIALNRAGGYEPALRRFQEAGYFFTECVECPTDLSAHGEFDALIGKLQPTLERRIRFSYRPKAILLISKRLTGVGEALARASLEAQILGRQDKPVSLAKSADAAGRERFRDEVATLLTDFQASSG